MVIQRTVGGWDMHSWDMRGFPTTHRLGPMRVVTPIADCEAGNKRSETIVRELAQVLDQCGDAVIVKDLNALIDHRAAQEEW